jgi:hypothetical protein
MRLFMLFSVLLGKLISTTSDATAPGETIYRVKVIKTLKVKKFDILIVCLTEKELVSHTHSSVSRVWQVGHVPWAPLGGGATERFSRLMFPYRNVLKKIF